MLEWIAIAFSRGSTWSRDRTQVSCNASTYFTIWAIREDSKWASHSVMVLAIERNESESVLMRCVNLEPIGQSEVNWKEKNKVYIWNLESWYWQIYLHSSNGHTDTENSFMDTVEVGEEGKGGMCAESNMGTYITICKIHSQWGFAVWLRELRLGLCNNLERWDGERGGRGHLYTYGWFMVMFGRNQQNTVK